MEHKSDAFSLHHSAECLVGTLLLVTRLSMDKLSLQAYAHITLKYHFKLALEDLMERSCLNGWIFYSYVCFYVQLMPRHRGARYENVITINVALWFSNKLMQWPFVANSWSTPINSNWCVVQYTARYCNNTVNFLLATDTPLPTRDNKTMASSESINCDTNFVHVFAAVPWMRS